MKSLYILLVTLVLGAVSCRTKEGEPGPAGESDLTRQGKISGTLAYVDRQGNPLSLPFEYNYFETLSDNKFYYDNATAGKEYYRIELFRRALKDYNNYFNFYNLFGTQVNGQPVSPTSGSFEFSMLQVINNNLFEFYGNFDSSSPNSTYTVSNFSFDVTTGRLVFNFVLTFDPSDIDYYSRFDDTTPATITGTVDVILNRAQTFSLPPVQTDL